MYLYYGMILSAAAMFAAQFLFNQKFQQRCGDSGGYALSFSAYTSAAVILIMLVLNGFRMEFSWFSLGIALLSAVCMVACCYAGMKALATVNLVGYSMFSMLGGMIIPFQYGILFEGEAVTAAKVICSLLITAAMLMGMIGKGDMKKGVFFYFAVFFLNGMSGVWSIMHQANLTGRVDSVSYTIWTRVMVLALCLLTMLVTEKKITGIPRKTIPYIAGFAVLNGIGSLFLLVALNYLPASVQYPIVTGGTMVFSAMISVVRREKLTAVNIAATGLALAATIVIAL